jgi:hypothetical protein
VNDTPPSDGFRDLLDSSFGDGPAHRPVAATLRHGRRRLLRRRAASGVGTLAVAGVMVTSFVALAGGSPPLASIDPADATSTAPADCTPEHALVPDWRASDWESEASYTATWPGEDLSDVTVPDGCHDPTEPYRGSSGFWSSSIERTGGRSGEIGADVDLDADGLLHHADDVTIEHTIDNPASEVAAPDHSMAVQYVLAGKTYRALLTFYDFEFDCGSWSSVVAPADDSQTLEQWVDAELEGGHRRLAGACPPNAARR